MGTAGNSMLPGGNVSIAIKKGEFDPKKTYKTHEENIYVVAFETAAMKIIEKENNIAEQKELVAALFKQVNDFYNQSKRLTEKKYSNEFIEKYLKGSKPLGIANHGEIVKFIFEATIDQRWGAVETDPSKLDPANRFWGYHGDRFVDYKEATNPTMYSACATHLAAAPKIDLLKNVELSSYNKAAAKKGSKIFKVLIANGACANANKNAAKSKTGTSKRTFNLLAGNKFKIDDKESYPFFICSIERAQLGKLIAGAIAGGTHYIADATGAGVYAPNDKVGDLSYSDEMLKIYPTVMNTVLKIKFSWRGNTYQIGELYKKVALVDIPTRVQGKTHYINTTDTL
jgi:hypothetical protein